MSRCMSAEERSLDIQLSVSKWLTTHELDRQISFGLFERPMLDKPILSSMKRKLVSAAFL